MSTPIISLPLGNGLTGVGLDGSATNLGVRTNVNATGQLPAALCTSIWYFREIQLADGAQNLYRHVETSGTTMHDSGNAPANGSYNTNAVLNESIASVAPGLVGSETACVLFNNTGSGTYPHSDPNNSSTGNWSIEGLIQVSFFNNPDAGTLACNGAPDQSGNHGIWFTLHATGGDGIGINIGAVGGGVVAYGFDVATSFAGVPGYYCATYDDTAKIVTVYWWDANNGLGSASGSAQYVAGSEPFELPSGGAYEPYGNGYTLIGYRSDTAVYNYVLSPNQIKAHIAAIPNLVLTTTSQSIAAHLALVGEINNFIPASLTVKKNVTKQLAASLSIDNFATKQLTPHLTVIKTTTKQLSASLSLADIGANDIPASLTIAKHANNLIPASLTVIANATPSLSPHLTVIKNATGQLSADMVIGAKITGQLASHLTVTAAVDAQLDAVMAITFAGVNVINRPAHLTIRTHATPHLSPHLSIHTNAHKSLGVSLVIGFPTTMLVLTPPDANLPINQTLLYRVRKVYSNGFETIPTGIFLSDAGTMNPPGITTTGKSVLTPYHLIGIYEVTFVETDVP
jgi:hypothetical protein